MLLVLALTVTATAPLHPQAESSPERWKVSAELSFTDQSGNKVLRLLTGGLKISHLQTDDFRLDTSLRTRYGKSDGELVAFSHNASIALDFRPESYWSPFMFADADRDELKRLDVRLSSGAGGKRTLYRADDGDETSLSLALLYSFERIAPQAPEEGEPIASAKHSHQARWSLRGRSRFELRDGVTLSHTTFFQPLWDEMADYLLRSNTSLKVLLTERLALSVEYQIEREARPPEGIAPNDRLLTTGLIIDF
jgi:hypothetical protein